MVGCLPFGVSTGCGRVGSLGLQDLPNVWRWSSGRVFQALVVCPLLLSSLSLCAWCVVFEYGSISRFKGVFSGFWAFRVGLCCLGALRGLWGFCVREWLGGFTACCVFASIFPLLCLLFYLFTCFLSFILSALFWLSFACPLALSFLSCFVL